MTPDEPPPKEQVSLHATARAVGGRLFALGAFQRGSFRLASGLASDVYVDVRIAAGSPGFLELVARHATPYVLGHDALAGVALGGVPIATAMAMVSDRPMVTVRGAVKAHGAGAGERTQGPALETGAHVLVVEDVVTTAGSLVSAIEALRAERDVAVGHAVCIVDREAGGREALADAGVALHALVTMSELRQLPPPPVTSAENAHERGPSRSVQEPPR